MARARDEAWGWMAAAAARQPGLDRRGPAQVASAARSPPPSWSGAPPAGSRDRSGWGWNWSETKRRWSACSGPAAAAGRTAQFERVYDLTERVLPAADRALPTRGRPRRSANWSAIAARAHGRRHRARPARLLPAARPRTADAAVAELVEAGELLPVAVEGWSQPAYLTGCAAAAPGPGAALLAPFDPLIWERERTERMFDFHYRIEIYTPVAQRMHGYYVLPFLLDDRLVARVDLKADRAAGGC